MMSRIPIMLEPHLPQPPLKTHARNTLRTATRRTASDTPTQAAVQHQRGSGILGGQSQDPNVVGHAAPPTLAFIVLYLQKWGGLD